MRNMDASQDLVTFKISEVSITMISLFTHIENYFDSTTIYTS